MDICTLIIATVMTTQACFSKPTCEPPADGRQLCLPALPAPCPKPLDQYQCIRPDGSKYVWNKPR